MMSGFLVETVSQGYLYPTITRLNERIMALRTHGVLAIVFGLILLIFPEFGLWTLTAVLGFILLLIGLGLLAFGAFTYHASKVAGVAFLVLGVLGLIVGVGLFGNVGAFATLAGLGLYIGGFLLIITGLIQMLKPWTRFSREVGLIGIIMGALYLILGSFAVDPRGLSFLMGIWLIIAGVTSLL
jgi:membrane protein HdeD